MRIGWRGWMLVALGGWALGWVLSRPPRPLDADDASVYGDEAERMQDA